MHRYHNRYIYDLQFTLLNIARVMLSSFVGRFQRFTDGFRDRERTGTGKTGQRKRLHRGNNLEWTRNGGVIQKTQQTCRSDCVTSNSEPGDLARLPAITWTGHGLVPQMPCPATKIGGFSVAHHGIAGHRCCGRMLRPILAFQYMPARLGRKN